MTRLTARFVMLIVTAAVVPLVVYGVVSIGRLRAGIENSVEDGNARVAEQVATQLQLYLDTNARILRSVGAELTGTRLAPWQQSRILRNHVLEFREFREITLFGGEGRAIATSRIGDPATLAPSSGAAGARRVLVLPVFDDEDSLPATDLAVPLGGEDEQAGWIVARISLEELWRFVDRVRVGTEGYALVLSEDERLIAHGDPRQKRLIALPPELQRDLPELRMLAGLDPAQPAFAARYRDAGGREMLAAGARVADPGWMVMVEQPTAEAFAMTTYLRRQLLAAIGIALLGTVTLGWIWSRSIIGRIAALTAATRALAAGRMTERVTIGGRDEIRQLGDSFNAMADRLVELQEDVRRQERQAMFGKVAAGLVHDLSHPIQNIGNNCKLIVRMHEDPGYRETFRLTVDRELLLIQRVLDDLRNIARPTPLQRVPIDVNRSAADAVESMRQEADAAGVSLTAAPASDPLFIEADALALGRVYRNLITNAIQATAPGGSIVVAVEPLDGHVGVSVRDTGCGIPPERLAEVFDDFVTTKRRGLGLGLAISRKIVEQLGGQITVVSEVDRGTTFTLAFPRTRARPMPVAG